MERHNKSQSEEKPVGKLSIVSTPIGNDDDITLRALKALRLCDVLVCEEAKEGAKLLHKHSITKDIEQLNEHNEREQTRAILKMISEGKKVVLISDHGTPLLADPGAELVRICIEKNIFLEIVPGVSSVMTAVVRSGFDLNRFIYAGFLSREKDVRMRQVRSLSSEASTIVLLESPYRLLPLLEAARTVMPDRRAYIGCNLTMQFETHHYGSFKDLYAKFTALKFKGEFVLVFEGNPNPLYSDNDSGYADKETARSYSRPDDSRGRSSDRPRSGGYSSGGRREGGYKPRESSDRPRSGGYSGGGRSEGGYQRREGSDRPRSGGYNRHEEGESHSGGESQSRESSDRPRSSGYSGGGRTEGGYQRREGSDRPRSGYGGGGRGEGGYKPRESSDRSRSGGYGGGGRSEGGYHKRDDGGEGHSEGGYQHREGGTGRPNTGGYKKREGGSSRSGSGGYKKREGGDKRPSGGRLARRKSDNDNKHSED